MLKNDYLLSSTEGYYGEGRYNAKKKYLLYNQEKYIDDYKYLYRKTNFIKKILYQRFGTADLQIYGIALYA